jgi:hypothetical protein
MAKKKLKKFFKKAAPLLALGLGAAALGRRRRQANEMKTYLAEEGGDRSSMTSRPNMLDIAGAITKPRKKRSSVLADPRINKMDTSEVDLEMPPVVNRRIPGQTVMASPRINTGAFDIGFKNGGTVVKTGEKIAKRKKKIGIQIKGFGKARRS